eukprot:scaffold10626_cov17-Tisochrysis_lutea.AAC.1
MKRIRAFMRAKQPSWNSYPSMVTSCQPNPMIRSTLQPRPLRLPPPCSGLPVAWLCMIVHRLPQRQVISLSK